MSYIGKIIVACEYSGIVRDAFEDAGWDAWSCDILPTESEQTKAAGKHIQADVLRLFGERYISRESSVYWHGFAMFGKVLMAKKEDIKQQVEIDCSGTGCVRDGEDDINIRLERSKFPNGFNHEDYEIIGYSCENEAVNANYNIPKKWDLLIGHPPCTYLSFAYTGKERYSNERLQNKINAYQFFLDLWNAPIEHICLENPMGYVHTGLLPYTQIVEPYYFGHEYKKKTCLWLKNLPKLQYHLTDTLWDKKTAEKPTKIFLDNMTKAKRKGNMFSERESVLSAFATKKERSRFHTGIARAMAEQWSEYFLNNK